MNIKKQAFCFVFLISICFPGCQQQDYTDRTAPLLAGMGDHHHPVSTDIELAQRFFNQGLILSYGFNHAEAHRSFLEATRLDSNCAMAYWGAALVLGPNINAPMDPADAPKAYEILQKAVALVPNASEKEQAYIHALVARYAAEAPEDRSELDAAYSDAMRQVYHKYPNDLDAAALFAESLMDLHPWNYWEKSGEMKPWTPEILQVLEYVMEKSPSHPGASHFYIHAVEASRTPERALGAADRLSDVVPGAGHLVHMPSHIYIRVGQYHKGSLANERALQSDDNYITQCREQGIYPMAYVPHNAHFLWATATMEGASAKAIAAAINTSDRVDTTMMREPGLGTLQHFWSIPLYAYVRFAKWDEILAYPEPAEDLIYPRGVWHYARGVAFARTQRFAEAEQELRMVKELGANPVLETVTIWDINGTVELVQIAAHALSGELAAAMGKHDKAIGHLRAAIAIEDALNYTEPPDWFFPVRHSLGAVLLEASRPAEAEQVYRDDLATFPENGWSLWGLKKSLEMQNKTDSVNDVAERLEKAWAWADIELTASRL